MEMLTFKGYCPACELQNHAVKMRYNLSNELECPTCNLRVYPDGKKLALIHRLRGKNEFALRVLPTFTEPLYYTRADVAYDSYSDGSLLLTPEDLAEYITEVNTKACQNILEVLIDSYIDAFYKDKNTDYYNLISQLVDIDISQTVFNNDKQNNIYLFHYLHYIIECYEADNLDDIDDFLQTGRILDLCEQHLTPYDELVKEDLFLQNLRIKKYMVELIKVIYKPMAAVK